MKIIKDKIEISELQEICVKGIFLNVLKAVVDIDKRIMAIDAEFHSDLMEILMKEENSEPNNLWGINIFPEKADDQFIMFDSMINLKPGLGNKTMGVDNLEIRKKILEIIKTLIAQ